jgi:hypothetical protein
MRRRVEGELAGARQHTDAEEALRARGDAELERLRAELDRARADAARARAELAGLQERGADELRRLVETIAAAGRREGDPDQVAGTI